MYIDIGDNDLGLEPTIATFKETGPSRPVAAVVMSLAGRPTWCAITGWDAGPVPAYITPIEESGDGPDLLVHGGAQGLRWCPLPSEPQGDPRLDWSDDRLPFQVDAFLILTPETRWR